MTETSKVFSIIEAIASTSSKNEKVATLMLHAGNEMLKRVLEYAYNPFNTYGINALPDKTESGTDEFDSKVWLVLDSLKIRFLTGNQARDAVQGELNRLTDDAAELLRRIIRKDMRAGFSASTINKVWKGLIPEFSYQRCSLPKDVDLDSFRWDLGVFSQEKADGMFFNLDHDGTSLSLRTRQGNELPLGPFAHILEVVECYILPHTQTHGEIRVVRDGKFLPREVGNGMLNSVLEGGQFEPGCTPHFAVWDQIPLSSAIKKGRCETPYAKRLGSLSYQVSLISKPFRPFISVIPTRLVRSLKEAYRHSSELMKQGKEGTVIKDPLAPWADGTSKYQVKLKLEFEVDLEVIAIEPGAVGTKNEGRAGALRCRTSDDLLQVSVAIKNEKMRDHVDAHSEEWKGKIVPVVANDIMLPSPSSDLHSLFLPRLAEANYRKDKVEADSLERVFAIKAAAIEGEAIKSGKALAEVA